jgi:hypothetical protein
MPFEPVDIRLTLYMPATLKRLVVSIGLLFRRLRYGCRVGLIPVGQGKYAIVDADDYERLAKYKWQLRSSGHASYAFRYSSTRGGKKRQTILMHREVIDIPEGLVCDHINRKALDNRKANVRSATSSQNSCNRRNRAKTTSRYRGVSQAARSNKWRAQIRANGRSIHLGMFGHKVDAAKAYDAVAKKYHGEFAVLNFPDRPPSWIMVSICGFFAKIVKRIKPSLRTSPKAEPSNLLTSHCEAEGRGNLKPQATRLPRRPQGGLLAMTLSSSILSTEHRFSICRFFEKIGQNSVKVRETCENLIEIVQECARMNTVQMARGP